jgi:hypothetical protein
MDLARRARAWLTGLAERDSATERAHNILYPRPCAKKIFILDFRGCQLGLAAWSVWYMLTDLALELGPFGAACFVAAPSSSGPP